MVYEIIKSLEETKETNYRTYSNRVSKGRLKTIPIAIGNKVFEDSFDAKECCSEEFIIQKLQ